MVWKLVGGLLVKILRRRTGPALVALLTLALCSFRPVGAAAAETRLAVVPLSAVDTNDPYAPRTTPQQLDALTASLRSELRNAGLTLLPSQRVDAVLRGASFDQTRWSRACADAACALRIGKAAGADAVLIGTIFRPITIQWNVRVRLVAVPSGRALGEYATYILGDVESVQGGEASVGTCVARLVHGRTPCPIKPGPVSN